MFYLIINFIKLYATLDKICDSREKTIFFTDILSSHLKGYTNQMTVVKTNYFVPLTIQQVAIINLLSYPFSCQTSFDQTEV